MRCPRGPPCTVEGEEARGGGWLWMASRARYAGKVVVVTGGGRGIGAGIVRAFESNARVLEQQLPGAVFIRCDVTREEDLRTLIAETVRRFGRLDCLVNNAGYHPPAQLLEDTSAQDFRQLLELNLLGSYTLTKLALPHLRKSQGNVINISSLCGAIGQSQALPYVATKGALTAMTKSWALDESKYGVRVNCISPGNIWTPLWEMLAASSPDPKAEILKGVLAQPLGRMGQPSEVGAAAVFLASEATFCTGIELRLTGGAELGYGSKASPDTPLEVPTLPPDFPRHSPACDSHPPAQPPAP
ncbi:PREDICTED: 17-beta-hydroxysteroid dehydrogenase 14 isoform X2 [Chinchilla lanigera]|uniref:17-beta-hydroxysteroid dehydrogenase 14 isoform X2 n=1 Tax=Chinchilla lanigera TaxID=34839 RepID=UPI0006976A82|nr:PREDICTED: 17-beta-hydroxysteroid dehydrogenase 14 isoform X2 [Chinchilla lanigera]